MQIDSKCQIELKPIPYVVSMSLGLKNKTRNPGPQYPSYDYVLKWESTVNGWHLCPNNSVDINIKLSDGRTLTSLSESGKIIATLSTPAPQTTSCTVTIMSDNFVVSSKSASCGSKVVLTCTGYKDKFGQTPTAEVSFYVTN